MASFFEVSTQCLAGTVIIFSNYQIFREYKETQSYCKKTPSSAMVHASVNIVKRTDYLETYRLSMFLTSTLKIPKSF